MKLYKRYKDMVRELEQYGNKSLDEPVKILRNTVSFKEYYRCLRI